MNKPLTGVTRRKLRSSDWFNNPHNPGMTALYLERYLNYGLTRQELQSGKPIIGIAQTGSDLSPCNRHHLELADRVREGIRAAGEIDYDEFMNIVASAATSVGHCNTMGTASTMNSLAEALGMSLPGCAAIPAPYRERGQIAYETGTRIVSMVWEDLKPSDILTRKAFENCIVVNSAIGGSTNAPIHINALARHIGVELSIDDWQKFGHDIPLLVNMQPAGFYLGEDYHARIDDPSLNIDEHCILFVRGTGPIGYPGGAEVVNMQPPAALIKRGILSLPCIGDGRQSGTSGSPSILNATPEAAADGGLAILKTGDKVRIDLNQGSANILISDQELKRRRAELKAKGGFPHPANQTPWQELYRSTVGQHATGACMEFATRYHDIAGRVGVARANH